MSVRSPVRLCLVLLVLTCIALLSALVTAPLPGPAPGPVAAPSVETNPWAGWFARERSIFELSVSRSYGPGAGSPVQIADVSDLLDTTPGPNAFPSPADRLSNAEVSVVSYVASVPGVWVEAVGSSLVVVVPSDLPLVVGPVATVSVVYEWVELMPGHGLAARTAPRSAHFEWVYQGADVPGGFSVVDHVEKTSPS